MKITRRNGQLPKFEEDLFKISNEELYLIPTAEVPFQIFMNKILNPDGTPISMLHTLLVLEARGGSYGKDTKE